MKTMIIAQQRFVAAATRKPLNSLVALPHCHSQIRHRVAKASSIPSPSAPTAVDDDDAAASSTVSQQQQQHEQLLLHIDKHHVLHPYTSMTSPIPTHLIQSARGIHLQLHNGKQVIDGMSSWWAAMHGYRHPYLDNALQTQAIEYMSHVMFGGLSHRPAVGLAARLLKLVNGDEYYSSQQKQQQQQHDRIDNTIDDNNNSDYYSNADDDFLNSSSLDLDKMQHHYQLTKVFFSDSGSISIEVAMKMAMQYWSSQLGHSHKNKFLALRGGYHGDTLGAMSVCDPDNGMRDTYFGEGAVRHQYFVPNPIGPRAEDAISTLNGLEEAVLKHKDSIAAMIVEPIVQGAGGMKFYHPIVLKRMRELCDDHGILLIFDEIATGFGRTGTLFAGWHNCGKNGGSYRPWSSLYGYVGDEDDEKDVNHSTDAQNCTTRVSVRIYPDILCLGKALTGGYMTMGATLTTNEVARGISERGGVFMHGPTFMANPLACAISSASMDLLIHSPWEERVRNVERKLIDSLSPLAELESVVKEVRVLGAIGVCELRQPLDREKMVQVQNQLIGMGVWLRPFGKLLYTMPPFNCEGLQDEHVKKIGNAMLAVASGLK
ncbi:hypothetical protein ACHAXH_003916 [Discostella pseudostelligera]